MGTGRSGIVVLGVSLLAIASCGNGGASTTQPSAATAVAPTLPSTVTTTAPTTTAPTTTSAPAPFDPNGSTTAPRPITGSHWVASTLPDGYEPVMLQASGQSWTVYYARPDAAGDLFDAPLRVVGMAFIDGALDRPYARTVSIAGHDATVMPLQSDGQTYGTVIAWHDEPSLLVSVEAADPLTERDAMSVAAGLRQVDDAEWDRLRRGLSIDSQVGTPDPSAMPVVAIHRTIDGRPYELIAYIPPDYPLGDFDRRLACYSVSFEGESSGVKCGGSWWLRVGSQVFVFGPAGEDATSVVVSPAEGLAGKSITTEAVRVANGPPGMLYVQPLPDGYCYVTVVRVDGGNLGEVGPLGGPDQDACLAKVANRSGPPTTAR